MISLGSIGRDCITGFLGTVIARTEYLYAVPSVLLAANHLNNEVPIPEQWFSESRIIVVENAPPNVGHFL